MIRRVVATLVPLLFVTAGWALDEPKDKDKADPPKPPTAAEKLKALQQEVQKSRSETIAKYRKAEKEEEKQELLQKYFGIMQTYADKFLDLAKDNPKDAAAVQALLVVVTEAGDAPAGETAAELIVKDHLGDKQVLARVSQLGRSSSRAAETVLRAVMAKAEAKDDQGKATFALAQSLKERVEAVRTFKDVTPAQLAQAKARLGEAALRQLRDADPAKLEAEVEKLFETVMEKYADVMAGRGTLGAQAKPELFEMKHLSVGKTAPDIAGEDVDGVKFKLSDYRGKVVMLDFWGHW